MTTISKRFASIFLSAIYLGIIWSFTGKGASGSTGVTFWIAAELSLYSPPKCKLKEEHKSTPPAEIEAEVGKAKQFTPLIDS